MDIVEYVKSFPLKNFTKSEVLLSAGEITPTIFIVREGIVKASSVTDDGNEQLLWLAGRYDVVPTESMFSTKVTTQYFYTAFCDGSAYVLDKADFLLKAQSDQAVMSQIARGLSEHHDDLLARLNSIEQPNLHNKILYMLYALCEKFSGADIVNLHELGLNLTHQDMADMVHATREAVSLELKQLQDDGLVDYSRSTFTVQAKKIREKIEASM